MSGTFKFKYAVEWACLNLYLNVWYFTCSLSNFFYKICNFLNYNIQLYYRTLLYMNAIKATLFITGPSRSTRGITSGRKTVVFINLFLIIKINYSLTLEVPKQSIWLFLKLKRSPFLSYRGGVSDILEHLRTTASTTTHKIWG